MGLGLGKLFSGGAGELVESVGGVLDNLTTSKEEKLEAKRKMKQLISDYETKMEQNITDRWSADMNSDSWLSKNVRPLVLIFLVVCTMLMIFIDAGTIACANSMLTLRAHSNLADSLTVQLPEMGSQTVDMVLQSKYENNVHELFFSQLLYSV